MQLGLGPMGEKVRPPRSRGYLLVLVAICVSILSLSYLRLASSAAISDDKMENEVARVTARYAAESGLILMEHKLAKLKAPPPSGAWFAGEFVDARFKVSVASGGEAKKGFTVISSGTSSGDAGVLISRSLEADVKPAAGGRWTVSARRELSR